MYLAANTIDGPEIFIPLFMPGERMLDIIGWAR